MADGLSREGVLIRQLQGRGAKAWAIAAVPWPGGAVSNFASPLVVAHGLAQTPSGILLANAGNTGVTLIPSMAYGSLGATTFNLFVNTVDGQTPLNTAVSNVFWVAF